MKTIPIPYPTDTLNHQIEDWFDSVVSYIYSFVKDEKMADKITSMVRRHGRLMYQLGYGDAKNNFHRRFNKLSKGNK